jgi:hypothetical protein
MRLKWLVHRYETKVTITLGENSQHFMPKPYRAPPLFSPLLQRIALAPRILTLRLIKAISATMSKLK